ncbi:MAG: RNase P subunit p30 family protein [Candidatus Aenigmatarchaeota archaeon]|nr:PHP domain-containing protein [Candidatus Aenigmarchaeota archaeon]
MKFYDLHIHSKFSVGDSTPNEIVEIAEKLGLSCIAITDNFESLEKLNEIKKAISEIKSNVEVIQGVYITAQTPQEMKQKIDKVRNLVPLVIVAGGDYQINRAACEDSRVDILAHPELNRHDNGLDETCLNAAAENNVAIEINLRQILTSYRKIRANILHYMSINAELTQKFNVPLIVCSGAHSKWEMRDGRELISIANLLGLDIPRAFESATSIPEKIIETNKKKLSGKIITNGVEIV